MLHSKNEQQKNIGGIELINNNNKRIQDSNENSVEEQNGFFYLYNETTESGTYRKEEDEVNFEIIKDVKIIEAQKESVKGEDIYMEVKQECEQNKEDIVNSVYHIASNKISSKNNQLKKKRKRGKEKSEKKEKSESPYNPEFNTNEFKVAPFLIPTPKKRNIKLELFPNLQKNRQKAPLDEFQLLIEARKSQNLYKKYNILNKQNTSSETHKKRKKAPLEEIQLSIESIKTKIFTNLTFEYEKSKKKKFRLSI